MAGSLRSSSPFVVVGLVITFLIILSIRSSWQSVPFAKHFPDSTVSKLQDGSHWRHGTSDTSSDIGRAGNATLGFEKVLVVGLKQRSDRRDTIVLQSSLTGFNVDWIDGCRGEDVPDKALPLGMDRGIIPEPNIGSWRGHMNAIRSILENGLSSALIMEDDVDWDVRLLSQMREFAKGVRYLQNIRSSEKKHSPYGDDWDIIWPGHCGEVLPKDDDRRYVINDDETVAPKEHLRGVNALGDYPDHTRLIHKTGAPICTFAYAVSAQGAQKILTALALKGSNLAFDNLLAYFCRDNVLNIKCFSVQPSLFIHHRPAGSINKDSNIQQNDKSKVREKGFTENIVWSTRLNLEKLILGTTDYVMQW